MGARKLTSRERQAINRLKLPIDPMNFLVKKEIYVDRGVKELHMIHRETQETQIIKIST